MKTVKMYLIRRVYYPCVYKRACRKPIQENKIVFMEVRLAGLSNSYQLLYDELVQNYDFDIHCHFLRTGFAKKGENRSRVVDFLRDMATAKYVVYDEGSPAVGSVKKRKGTKILQTWHGCGAFKRFGFSTANYIFGDKLKDMKRFPAYADYDYVTVSSPEVVWAYVEAMNKEKNPECVKPVGLSRTDVFFDQKYIDSAYEKLYELLPAAKDKKHQYG